MSAFGRVGLGLSTDDARAFAGNLQTQIATVTNVLGEMQQQTTPSADEIGGAISSLSTIENALRNFIAQDGAAQYGRYSNEALSNLLGVTKVLVDEQQNVAQHSSTGFVPPLDSTAVQGAVTQWTTVLQDIGGGFQTMAAQIDNAIATSSAQASAGAAAQAAAQAAQAAGGSPSPGTPTTPTPTTPMPTGPATPGPTTVVPPTTASSSSTAVVAQKTILGMTPPVALLAGVGVLLIAGLMSGYLAAPAPVAKAAKSVGIDLPQKKKKRRARR